MLLANLLRNLPQGLSPDFRSFILTDHNPLGGTTKRRVIYDPNPVMRRIHRRLISLLRHIYPILPYATACRPGLSPRTHVQRHYQNRFFYSLDLTAAYPSVCGVRLARLLARLEPELGEFSQVFDFLAAFCLTPNTGLITGAPASPDLFNIYAAELLDRPLGAWCKEQGLTYTRYLDDLIFSSRRRITEAQRRYIRTVIAEAEFQVNHRKSTLQDLAKGPIVLNGIGISRGGRIFLPRHYLRKLRGLLHRALTKGDVEPQTIHGMMGVFWGVTGRSRLDLNATERKLLALHARWKATQPSRRLRQPNNSRYKRRRYPRRHFRIF